MVQIKVLISGSVQRIGYRYFVYDNAKKLGLYGYVKNLSDGRVEAVFDGDRDRIERIIEIISTQHPVARIKDVSVKIGNTGESFFEFKMQR